MYVCVCVQLASDSSYISDYCAWVICYNHARRCRRGSTVHESCCAEHHLYTDIISSGLSAGVIMQLWSRRTGSELRNSVIVVWSPCEWMHNNALEHAQWVLCGTRGCYLPTFVPRLWTQTHKKVHRIYQPNLLATSWFPSVITFEFDLKFKPILQCTR